MLISTRQWLVATGIALYLYFALPATAVLFYELYHLTKIDAIYWGYSGFKAAGYYLGVYEYRLLVCLGIPAAVILVSVLFKMLRRR
ncbi:MAG: hypothetical protein KDI17_01100 [Halioglobus sp.]|nr:hypothetical protein [Halioglobus sp.]